MDNNIQTVPAKLESSRDNNIPNSTRSPSSKKTLRGQQYPRKIFTPTNGEEMPFVDVQILYEILHAIQSIY